MLRHCVPAESIRSLRSQPARLAMKRKTPSADGDLQILPMQTNKTPTFVLPCGFQSNNIAFVTTRWGHKQLAIIDRTGQNIQKVTDVGDNEHPTWQPFATK